jgi:hypothetical protein
MLGIDAVVKEKIEVDLASADNIVKALLAIRKDESR